MATSSLCHLKSRFCGVLFRPPPQSSAETVRFPTAAPRISRTPTLQQRPSHRACSPLGKPLYKTKKKAASSRQAALQGSIVTDVSLPAVLAPPQDFSTNPPQDPAASKRNDIQRPEDDRVLSWKKIWFPVAILADLDVQKPTSVTLLNIEMVIWREQGGAWAAFMDRCPHRLAPLSEGRVEKGVLQCAYHGWAFDKKGTCVRNPHADSPQAEAKVCSDRRSRCQSFPTREAHGLLWVWPESGTDAWLEASMHALPEHPELLDPGWVGSEGPFNRLDEPINWDIMVENAMDLAHAPFVHHGVVAKMEDYRPMHAELTEASDDPSRGFEIQHDGYTQHQKEEDFKGTRRFTPNSIRVEYKYKSGRVDFFVLHFVPMKPGWTRGFLKVVHKNPPAIIKLVNRLPDWLLHSNALGIPDQDVLILHKQERNLRTSYRKGTKAYFLPNESDGGVIAFRTWLSEKAGGDVGWGNGATSADAGPQLPRSQLLNRFNRHAKGCHVCLRAMATIDRIRSALTFGAGVLFLLGIYVASRRGALANWVPAFIGAAVMLGLKEQLRRFRRTYVTGCNSAEVDYT
ncbi:hypothetical protein KFL_005770010 [Klebsormidium nitens]|uniref:Rieske domain-containing protein n=1 Tax=Klebsormidium nitens TaxID=105231 RepID=A0A1Y1IGC5_KLENI|nr:hypothetical protein KFL_005770010 [Klebsormidium nitens]|eukprot:GAQ89914.1 hypothetical protein KFL_005770010 [Klebsormidium nitens]